MTLKNKIVLITGGSSGLGLETARQFANVGANVIICAPNKEHIDKAIEGTNIKGVVCDVMDPSSIENMKKEIRDIDILINNAGIWLEGNLEDNDYDQISKMIDINVKGTIYTTKAFLPMLKEKDSGVILNVSSTSGIKAKPKQSAYVASKFAIQGFTEALKEDLINSSISVLGFYPGGMKTDIFKKAGSNRDVSSFMDIKDIAKSILFIIENCDKISLDHVVITRPKI